MQEMIHYDYAIGMPQRWIDASVVVIVGPPNDGYSPNITITRERLDFPMTSVEYAGNQLPALQRELENEGYEVVEEGPLALGNLEAYHRVHTFRMSDIGLEVKQLQVYIVSGTDAITITCTNLTHLFENTKPTFLEAIKRFGWRAPGAPSSEGGPHATQPGE